MSVGKSVPNDPQKPVAKANPVLPDVPRLPNVRRVPNVQLLPIVSVVPIVPMSIEFEVTPNRLRISRPTRSEQLPSEFGCAS
jgi:hypothetical protein